jgi:hypothetical protein
MGRKLRPAWKGFRRKHGRGSPSKSSDNAKIFLSVVGLGLRWFALLWELRNSLAETSTRCKLLVRQQMGVIARSRTNLRARFVWHLLFWGHISTLLMLLFT